MVGFSMVDFNKEWDSIRNNRFDYEEKGWGLKREDFNIFMPDFRRSDQYLDRCNKYFVDHSSDNRAGQIMFRAGMLSLYDSVIWPIKHLVGGAREDL
tara:strand:- start:403 stop:693 length:291 start_codon:yes stop_codon:yes gene_type:complete